MPEHAAPRGPRCGYDQRGAIATWSGSCPLDGVCSECGLAFLWRDVRRPGWITPRWSFEHAYTRLPWRWCSTVWRAVLIWPLWRGLRLEHPVAARRLGLHVAAILLAMHALAAGATAWLAYHDVSGLPRWWRPQAGEAWPSPIRVATSALAWPCFGFDLVRPARSQPFREPSLIREWAWAMLLWPLGAATSLLLLPQTLRRVRVRAVHVWRAAAYSLTPFPLILLLALVAILNDRGLRPINRLDVRLDRSGLPSPSDRRPALPIILVLWTVAYRMVTPRRYLRLPHAAAVGLAALTIGGLLAALVATLGWLLLIPPEG